MVIAIGTLPLLLLELKRGDLPHKDQLFLDITNVLVLIAFAVDYVVELGLASNRRQYVRHEWTSLVIVVSQGLAVVPALSGFGVLRVLRGGRALRAGVALARLFAIGGSAAREGRTLLRRRAASFALGAAAPGATARESGCLRALDRHAAAASRILATRFAGEMARGAAKSPSSNRAGGADVVSAGCPLTEWWVASQWRLARHGGL